MFAHLRAPIPNAGPMEFTCSVEGFMDIMLPLGFFSNSCGCIEEDF